MMPKIYVYGRLTIFPGLFVRTSSKRSMIESMSNSIFSLIIYINIIINSKPPFNKFKSHLFSIIFTPSFGFDPPLLLFLYFFIELLFKFRKGHWLELIHPIFKFFFIFLGPSSLFFFLSHAIFFTTITIFSTFLIFIILVAILFFFLILDIKNTTWIILILSLLIGIFAWISRSLGLVVGRLSRWLILILSIFWFWKLTLMLIRVLSLMMGMGYLKGFRTENKQ